MNRDPSPKTDPDFAIANGRLEVLRAHLRAERLERGWKEAFAEAAEVRKLEAAYEAATGKET